MSATAMHPPMPWSLGGRATGARRILTGSWRAFTGFVLIAAMCGSVGLAYTVIHEHIGFQPVLSPSMVPTFRPGDLIITKAEPASAVKVGQIVALPIPNEPGQRYVHRIISVTERDGKPLVRTKGDANPAPEPFSLRIDSPSVPVVIATVPGFGRMTTLLRHGWLRLLIVILTIGCGGVATKRLVQSLRHPTDLTGTEDNR
jgi:signal peptidase I